MSLCCFYGSSRLGRDSPKNLPAELRSPIPGSSSNTKPVSSRPDGHSQFGDGLATSATQSPSTAPGTLAPKCPSPAEHLNGFRYESPMQSKSNSQASQGTSSSGDYASLDSPADRPQPVEELHSLVLADPEAGKQRQATGLPQDSNQEHPSEAAPDYVPPLKRLSNAFRPSTDVRKSRDVDRRNSKDSQLPTSKDAGRLGSPIKAPPPVSRQSAPADRDIKLLESNSNFKILHSLAAGPASSVFCCLDRRDQTVVAIKLVTRGISNARAAEREIANLRLCGLHPYIIHMREVFLTSTHLAIVFDYAPGGNLANYIETFQSSKPGKGLSEERTRWIFRQIVVAIDFCHKMGIVNRDIKMENVLLIPCGDDPTKAPDVKLSDFGFSKDELADSLCKTACGTPESVAPEILSGELYDGKSSDIWSLGVLFFSMLTGTFPFSRPSDDVLDNTAALRKLFLRIAKAQYPRPHHVSKSALTLLDCMLQVNPKDRIDIAGILSHPWFGSNMQDMALDVNQGLLEMPDAMLTGFAAQSEEEIAQIIQQSSHRSAQAHLQGR